MSSQPELLAVKDLFKERSYRVPSYQRGYRWTKAEIDTLLLDIQLASKGKSANYYVGSLVTQRHQDGGNTYYEVIDGQQRLTTLFIILSLIKKDGREQGLDLSCNAIQYASHRGSAGFLRKLIDGENSCSKPSGECELGHEQDPSNKSFEADAPYLEVAVEACRKALAYSREAPSTSAGSQEIGFSREVVSYLLHNTKILVVELPENTDLNHYFEIMNTRGKQLENHEVLKAQLMSELDEDSQNHFDRVWYACADFTQPLNRLHQGQQEDLQKSLRALNGLCEEEGEENSSSRPYDSGSSITLGSILQGEQHFSPEEKTPQPKGATKEEEYFSFTPHHRLPQLSPPYAPGKRDAG